MSDSRKSELYNQWVAPDFSSNSRSYSGKKAMPNTLPTAAEVENTFNQAYEEGLAKGYADGLDKVEKEILEKKKIISNIINAFDSPYDDLSDVVIDNLKSLSLSIAGQIIRREISIDDSNIVSTVQRSIDLIKNIDSKLTIRLNPLDVPIVKDLLSITIEGSIHIDEDPSITRGGCKIESKSSCIDATIEEQLRIISSDLIGGSRSSDS